MQASTNIRQTPPGRRPGRGSRVLLALLAMLLFALLALLEGESTAVAKNSVPSSTTSNTWAGYVVSGPSNSPVTYSDVKARWRVPPITCRKGETSYVYNFVGIGGKGQPPTKRFSRSAP
jgi:hypothetical protein